MFYNLSGYHSLHKRDNKTKQRHRIYFEIQFCNAVLLLPTKTLAVSKKFHLRQLSASLTKKYIDRPRKHENVFIDSDSYGYDSSEGFIIGPRPSDVSWTF